VQIHPVGADFFPCEHRDRRTNRPDEANSRFSKVCDRSQNLYVLLLCVLYSSQNNDYFLTQN